MAFASQKLTVPVVSGVAEAATVAVSVTTVFAATLVAGLPPDVIARVVVVAGGIPHRLKAFEVAEVEFASPE